MKNPLLLCATFTENVPVPHPAAFAMWLRGHLDAIPSSESDGVYSVTVEKIVVWNLRQEENVSHVTQRNITLQTSPENFVSVVEWFTKKKDVGLLTQGDAIHFSIWVEKQIVGFITVKKPA